jgi:hypothetical protein
MSDTGKPTIWDVPVSPAERWQLVNLVFHRQANINTSGEGKEVRRMLRAFGLMPIRDALRAHASGVNPAMAENTALALHHLTIGNLDALDKLIAGVPRTTGTEVDLGEFFDRLDAARANEPDPAWAALPKYDEAAESWAPPREPMDQLVCPSCQQAFDIGEARTAAIKAASKPQASAPTPVPAPAADAAEDPVFVSEAAAGG